MTAMDVYIFAAKRTPFGKFWGALKDIPAPKLGAEVIKQILSDVGIDGEEIGGVFMGEVLTAGVGQNPARQASRYANLSDSCPAETFNKVCASSLVAMRHAAHAIQLGEANFMIAGGMENMSRAPYLFPRWKRELGDFRLGELEQLRISYETANFDKAKELTERIRDINLRFYESIFIDSMVHDGLRDIYDARLPHMGELADMCCKVKGISREEQDTYAFASHTRALEAKRSGVFDSQLVSMVSNGKSFDSDEGVREPNLEKLQSLEPAFSKNGTVTAGNASQISDGAAALLLSDGSSAAELRVKPLARIVAFAVHSQEPEWYTTAPVGAIQKVLREAGLQLQDIDLFEINEAFAVVPLHAMRELSIPHEKVNIWGGAIAQGHPIGASGARITGNLVHQLIHTDGRYGIAVACNGGGEAVAVLIENMRRKY